MSADDVHFPESLTVRYMKPVVVPKLDLTR